MPYGIKPIPTFIAPADITLKFRLSIEIGASEATAVGDTAAARRIAETEGAVRFELEREPVDLGFVALDMTGIAAFDRAVYAAALGIPRARRPPRPA